MGGVSSRVGEGLICRRETDERTSSDTRQGVLHPKEARLEDACPVGQAQISGLSGRGGSPVRGPEDAGPPIFVRSRNDGQKARGARRKSDQTGRASAGRANGVGDLDLGDGGVSSERAVQRAIQIGELGRKRDGLGEKAVAIDEEREDKRDVRGGEVVIEMRGRSQL